MQYDDKVDRYDRNLGHGTHVVGTLVGRRSIDGKVESKGVADGIAYDAKVAFVDVSYYSFEKDTERFIMSPITRVIATGRPHAKVHSAR